MCDVFAQGSSLETQHPGFFLDADHVIKFQSRRRKAGVQHKPHCLYGLDTASHPYHEAKFYLSVENNLLARFPDASHIDLSKIAVSSLLYLLFFSEHELTLKYDP